MQLGDAKQSMSKSTNYSIIGHITQDVTPQGLTLGGSVTYSGLTAAAFGHNVRAITSANIEEDLSSLEEFDIVRIPSEACTRFENMQTPTGRLQYLHQNANPIQTKDWPEHWKSDGIIHLAPIAQEVSEDFVHFFDNSFLCTTPQGWMRSWDNQGLVSHCDWKSAMKLLPKFQAVVISLEDVNNQEDKIEYMTRNAKVLAVTEAQNGSRVYWNGDVRSFRAPQVPVVDATGAGDIYAAAFFSRLYATNDPWHAAMVATHIATLSVTRRAIKSIPSKAEIQGIMVEIINTH